jgi:reversibly glycosylated polypeptide/UDP-arabinopyranose mutase
MKIAVVVPTIRPELLESAWRPAWERELFSTDAKLYVIHDTKSTWDEMYRRYGERSWIFTQGGAGIRCFGFLEALRDGADVICTFDDDVVPDTRNVIAGHAENLSGERTADAWWPVTEACRTRGLPFVARDRTLRPAISHGLWTGTPDLDGPTQLVLPWVGLLRDPHTQMVPRGAYFAMSGMNLAFTREIASAMYFPLMGADMPYDRFDDIWCGIIAKRVCDHLGLACVSGAPFVHHERASDPFRNLIKEGTGIAENERFWQVVDGAKISGPTVDLAVRSISYHLKAETNPYYKQLANALPIWCDLVREATT